MYGSNQPKIMGTAAAQKQQRPIPEAPCGGMNAAELRQSEIEREMNSLHFAIDALAQTYDSLQERLAPVSANISDTSASSNELPEPVPSCMVASGVFSARQRVVYLTGRVLMSIELLRC